MGARVRLEHPFAIRFPSPLARSIRNRTTEHWLWVEEAMVCAWLFHPCLDFRLEFSPYYSPLPIITAGGWQWHAPRTGPTRLNAALSISWDHATIIVHLKKRQHSIKRVACSMSWWKMKNKRRVGNFPLSFRVQSQLVVGKTASVKRAKQGWSSFLANPSKLDETIHNLVFMQHAS